MTDADCVAFLQWCLPRLDLRWPGFRKVRRQVCKRVQRRVDALGLAGTSAYRAHLRAHADEWDVLDGLCRITISRFFRDRAVFDCLGDAVLPGLARTARGGGRPLKAWCAGCASGEEAYSLRLLWDFRLAADFPDVAVSVIGTDVDRVLLRRARQARYPGGCLKELPAGWREAAFTPTDGAFTLRPDFRAGVVFRRQDVRKAMPAGPLDLVFCRNLVFTYFGPALQARLLARMGGRLAPGGALVLGGHETLPGDGAGLVPDPRCRAVWRRD